MQFSPAGFTFSIWGVIYLWQGLWVAYDSSFLCRPNAYRTINKFGVYIGFAIVIALNITWFFMWGFQYMVVAAAILFGLNLFFYLTIGLLVADFYKNSSKSDSLDRILTWVLPINGLFVYATWTTITSLINLTVVLEYSTGAFMTATQSGTVALSLLLVVLIGYFILENTVLFKALRYVFSVYPVVIWALIGVLSAHWGAAGEERNSRFTLGLLLVTVALFAVRIILLAASTIVSLRASAPIHAKRYATPAAV